MKQPGQNQHEATLVDFLQKIMTRTRDATFVTPLDHFYITIMFSKAPNYRIERCNSIYA